MHFRFSRRSFLAATGAAMLVPHELFGRDKLPAMLDHILLGSRDLDAGIAFVEQHTGLRAAFGGVHPGRGTRNALLSLGRDCYLEIIAPDPEQPGMLDPYGLPSLDTPRLVNWAVHPASLDEQARRLTLAGIAFEGPTPGSRNRPDGRVLKWRTLRLKDDRHGLLPFFIEWAAGSVHPSTDAPNGCRLVHFHASAPRPDELSAMFTRLEIQIRVEKADRPQLHAAIAGPQGELSLTS